MPAGGKRPAMACSVSRPMSPVRTIETSRQRSSSTIESSLRTSCRSQSGSAGWRTITSTSSIVNRSFVWTVRPSGAVPAAARRSAGIGAIGEPGCPPDLARPEVAHDRQEAADVIRVAVRDGGRIEAPDAVVTQDGADDAVADVERGRSRQSAGIDEQRRASGKPDQRGIALPHVQEGHVQRPVAARRDQARRLEEDPGGCGNAGSRRRSSRPEGRHVGPTVRSAASQARRGTR